MGVRGATYACVGLLAAVACSGDGGGGDAFGSGSSGSAGSTGVGEVGPPGDSGGTGGSTGGGTAGPKLDVGGGIDRCAVVDDMSGVVPCMQEAPADSFAPEVQWSWDAPGGETRAYATPLVANLTDDNDDGSVDLCDTPDIVVVVASGSVFALDGETGAEHWEAAVGVDPEATPALGDIDGDGLPEIVSLTPVGELVAIDNDGAVAWTSAPSYAGAAGSARVTALALADVDNDDDVEIILRNMLADHEGTLLWAAPLGPEAFRWSATIAADLDADDDLEIILGPVAFHHDGSEYYSNPTILDNQSGTYAQVADLDADAEPEILVVAADGLAVLEHTGATKYAQLTPTGTPAAQWNRPATIHDFDGDGVAEYASAEHDNYTVYEADATIVWTAMVDDASGKAGSTAFDFLGSGAAQAMYADENDLFVFDSVGGTLLSAPRTSITQLEYPVVADVDNDGSAEIVVVSNEQGGQQAAPTVQVIRDAEDRWIPARRIWNQHSYHVTNVREDATIPRIEPRSWTLLNTYRTQAQVEAGAACQPEG